MPIKKLLFALPFLFVAHSSFASSDPLALERYLYEEPFSRVFGKPNTDAIHNFQERLFQQAVKKGASGPRPQPIVMVGNSFRYADQSEQMKDLLLNPKMRHEAKAFSEQMALIEALISAQGLNPIHIQTEQFLQLIDHFFQLETAKDFEFTNYSNAEELTGRTTKRNSLLRYPAFLLQYLIGRNFTTGHRVDNRDYYEKFKTGLLSQPIFQEANMEGTIREITQWLDTLNNSASYYDTLSDPHFESQLSLKAWVAMASAIESFRVRNHSDSAKLLQSFFSGPEGRLIASVYKDMKAHQLNETQRRELKRDLQTGQTGPVVERKSALLKVIAACKGLLHPKKLD